MEEPEFLQVEIDPTEQVKALLLQYENLLKENRQLKKKLAEEQTTSHNYWLHIVWLRTPDDMKPHPKPCAFCGCENVGLDGSTCCREFFVWCDNCGAMGPHGDSEAKAILAWNKAGRSTGAEEDPADPELQEED